MEPTQGSPGKTTAPGSTFAATQLQIPVGFLRNVDAIFLLLTL